MIDLKVTREEYFRTLHKFSGLQLQDAQIE